MENRLGALEAALAIELPKLRHQAFVLCKSWADAEDLVQTTLARALAKLHQHDPKRGTLGAWLMGCIRNREMVEELAAAAARGASDVQFYFATREFAIDMAPGEIPPNLLTAWGGVGAVVSGELAVDRLWKTALDREALRADIQTAVDAVLGSLEAMDRSGAAELTWAQLFLEFA